ncbi:hypothetical protein GIB67_043276 [Kingdonia uniflora]|uniref:Uncharacterized protein n=1 Tax=Kingdonia uniflora TaxID=39325 RepID=A0A7J7L0Q5_9MAGN|nr:hypothetical protein GIB67_043276 [Kingdonia uniflora]
MYHPHMFDPNPHSHTLLNPMDMAQHPPENDGGRSRDDELESKSGSDNIEGGSGDEADPNSRPGKKKRYHRHTNHQINQMEAFFKQCAHPDDKQRKELGIELGLDPLQVKFWFQNKRTQMKTQHERHENNTLRAENDRLRAENMRYQEALQNSSCPNCGGPTTIGEMSFDEQQLRIENAKLKEEISRITTIAARYVGKPMGSFPLLSSQINPHSLDNGVGNLGLQSGMGTEMYGAGDFPRGPGEADRTMIIELAVSAMEELLRMAQLGDPLWVKPIDSPLEILNQEEYIRNFPRGIGPTPVGLKQEASRDTGVVIMNHTSLIEILMNVNQWSNMFSGIVSRAMTVEVLSMGVAANYNGALQIMTAEFQVPTPLVPTRESLFLRYSKQHSENTWVVVDVSLDHLRPSSMMTCRRRPSGCIIQEQSNGYSKVIWVEHMEVDERPVNGLYTNLVNSTVAFGAKRWVKTLERQCERLASAMASNVAPSDHGVMIPLEGRRCMLRLAERMVIAFTSGINASTSHTWTKLSPGDTAEEVRVMTRKSSGDPGRPPGIVLSAATSFWLPINRKSVFEFLRNENFRSQWDILSDGGIIVEMAHIANGRDPGNCVSLLRVNLYRREDQRGGHKGESLTSWCSKRRVGERNKEGMEEWILG